MLEMRSHLFMLKSKLIQFSLTFRVSFEKLPVTLEYPFFFLAAPKNIKNPPILFGVFRRKTDSLLSTRKKWNTCWLHDRVFIFCVRIRTGGERKKIDERDRMQARPASPLPSSIGCRWYTTAENKSNGCRRKRVCREETISYAKRKMFHFFFFFSSFCRRSSVFHFTSPGT